MKKGFHAYTATKKSNINHYNEKLDTKIENGTTTKQQHQKKKIKKKKINSVCIMHAHKGVCLKLSEFSLVPVMPEGTYIHTRKRRETSGRMD